MRFRVIATDGTRSAVAESPVFRVESGPPSPNAPALEFTSPQPGRVLRTDERVEVSWAASDPDGGILFFELHYSADRGATYRDTGWWLTEPSVKFHVPGNPAWSSTLRFKVVASDGTHRTSAESPIYQLERQP